MYFIDKRNFLILRLKNGNSVIMMFELDFETESARLKYEYLDNPTNHCVPQFIQKNKDRLLVVKIINGDTLEYNLYKIDVNAPLIDKYYEARSSDVRPVCPGLCEDKFLSFAYDRTTDDNPNKLYCFDLKTKKMDEIELDPPESINAIDIPDIVCF
jgi:hypothetical protein